MKNWKAIVQFLLPVFFAGTFSSCEQDTTLKLPAHTPRLVVHGYVETGNVFKIAVGKTFAADVLLPPVDTYVSTAIVALYENGLLKETLSYDAAQKRYVSISTHAIAGKTYRITVAAPGYETAEATTAAPFPVNTLAVSYIKNARTDQSGILLNDIIFRFYDPMAESNYYLAEINRAAPYSSSFCVYTYDPAVENFQPALNPFESGNCIVNNEILFSDKSFNGIRKEITISSSQYGMTEITDPFSGALYRPFLKRYSISEELYRYIKTVIGINGINEDPFSQPVSTYTNVKKGYGLFTVFSTVTDTLR
jgi:hypothetical protein